MKNKFKEFWKGSVASIEKSNADNLMHIDNQIWNKFGFGGGDDVHKNWAKYVAAVRSAVSGSISKKDADELEDQNFHSMLQALMELGKVKK